MYITLLFSMYYMETNQLNFFSLHPAPSPSLKSLNSQNDLKSVKWFFQINQKIQKVSENNHNSWKALQLICIQFFIHSNVSQVVSEKKLLAQFLLPFERYFCKKIIVTIIPTKLGGSFKLFFPFPLRITKSKNDVSENWWSNNKKYFCVLFIAKTTLFQ